MKTKYFKLLTLISLFTFTSCQRNVITNISYNTGVSSSSISSEDVSTDIISSSSNTSSSISKVTTIDFAVNNLTKSNTNSLFFETKEEVSKVEYKLVSETNYTNLDSSLIRRKDDKTQIHILGLKQGKYDIKFTSNSSKQAVLNSIEVTNLDLSGYAHFKNKNGVGGYNLDGSLKTNANVVYVNDSNKNTVSLKIDNKTYKGLANILKANTKGHPLVIRLIGNITTNQLKQKKFTPISSLEDIDDEKFKDMFYNEFEDTYENLDGLTSTLKGCSKNPNPSNGIVFSKASIDNSSKKYDTDSGFNNLIVSNVSNITIEGVFDDATILNWGFTFKSSSSIEVRNLTFTDYTEDACSFEGDTSDPSKYTSFFFHHNIVNIGKNNFDVSREQDKKEGDGGNDIKGISLFTSSYNTFNNCHKTGLIGGDDKQLTANVTYHHNFYNKCSSRLPLGRQANMHIYNNYYYSCSTAQDIRANAFVLSEYNYFENSKNAQKVSKNGVIKSFNDYFDSKSSSSAVKVSTRDKKVTNSCYPFGKDGISYQNFDTDSSIFYYDQTNKVSNVSELITLTSEVKTSVPVLAGLTVL